NLAQQGLDWQIKRSIRVCCLKMIFAQAHTACGAVLRLHRCYWLPGRAPRTRPTTVRPAGHTKPRYAYAPPQLSARLAANLVLMFPPRATRAKSLLGLPLLGPLEPRHVRSLDWAAAFSACAKMSLMVPGWPCSVGNPGGASFNKRRQKPVR